MRALECIGREVMAVTVDRTQVKQGMDVITSDGVRIGTVDAVQDQAFRINRPFLPDVRLPYSAVNAVTGDQVQLGIPDNEVDQVDWPLPPTGEVWPEE